MRELTDLAELAGRGRLLDRSGAATRQPADDASSCCAPSARPATTSPAPSTATRLVGACVGFFHAPARGRAAQPHRRGRRRHAGRNVGFALKLHQRAWALRARRLGDRLDLRPAGQPQRLLQPGQARRPAGRSTCRTSTARCSTPSTATTTPTGSWCAGGSGLGRVAPATGDGAVAGPSSPPAPSSRSGRRATTRVPGEPSTARRRWSPYPRHRGAAAHRPGARPARGGSRCATRWHRCSRPTAASPASTGAPVTWSSLPYRSAEEKSREARPASSCAGSRCRWSSPFRTSFGTQTARDILLLRAVTADGGGLGRVRRDGRAALLLGVRRRRRPTCCAASSCRRCVAAEAAPARGPPRSLACCARSRATGWPRPRSRWRCSTPSCGPPAGRSARELGAVRDRVPCGVSVGIIDIHPGAARRRRRLPRRGLRPDQAQDRARLGRRAGARRPRALRRRPAAAGRRQHRVHAARRPPPGPASTRSTCC